MILVILRHLSAPFVMAAGSVFLLSSCFPSSKTPDPGSQELPVNRTITDSKGRRLEVEIIGRSAESVTFIRESDRERFTVPVSNLSKEDQVFVAGLSMTSPEPPSDQESSSDDGPLGFEIARRNAILEDLDLISKEIPKHSKAPSKVNSLNREKERLNLELNAVNEEIRLLRSK
jgi:hypothetical protein